MSESEQSEARPAATPWPVRIHLIDTGDARRDVEEIRRRLASGGRPPSSYRARIAGSHDFNDRLFKRPW